MACMRNFNRKVLTFSIIFLVFIYLLMFNYSPTFELFHTKFEPFMSFLPQKFFYNEASDCAITLDGHERGHHSSQLVDLCEFSEQHSDAENQLFFIESAGYSLGPRSACSIESAVRNSGKKFVRVIFINRKVNVSNQIMRKLIRYYPQLEFYTVNVSALSMGSPVERLIPQIEDSKWRDVSYSDIVRTLLIYQFGGLYLDSDFIVLKSLEGIRNFIVPEDENSTNAAALMFSSKHDFVLELLKVMGTQNLSVPVWGSIGPKAATKALRTYNERHPLDVNILKTETFYPYHWSQKSSLFENAGKTRSLWLEDLDEKGALAVHLWNALTKKYKVTENANNTIFHALGSDVCPTVFNAGFLFS